MSADLGKPSPPNHRIAGLVVPRLDGDFSLVAGSLYRAEGSSSGPGKAEHLARLVGFCHIDALSVPRKAGLKRQ